MKLASLVTALVLGAASITAEAAIHKFCVGTDSELETALAAAPGLAQGNPTGTVDIRLRRRPGSQYTLADVPDTENGLPFGILKLRGGYSDQDGDDCS